MSGGYAPLFSSIATGTLYGRWPDIGVWPIVLSLADKNGVLDVTPQYLAGVTGLPVGTVTEVMSRFCQADPASRTKEQNGARLVLVDEHRDWGWRVVNHAKYREKARLTGKDAERTASGADAERKRVKRFEDVGMVYKAGTPCVYCGDACTGVDHIEWDGPDASENCVPCCHRCNTSKHRRPLLKFLNTCEWVDAERVMQEPKLMLRVAYDRPSESFVPRNFVCPPFSPSQTQTHTHTQTQTKTKTHKNTSEADFDASPVDNSAGSPKHRSPDVRALPPDADIRACIARIKAVYPVAARVDWTTGEKLIWTLIAKGTPMSDIEAGVRRYRALCDATNRAAQNPGAFFSAVDKPWLQPWPLPVGKNGNGKPPPDEAPAWAAARQRAAAVGFREPDAKDSLASYETAVRHAENAPSKRAPPAIGELAKRLRVSNGR